MVWRRAPASDVDVCVPANGKFALVLFSPHFIKGDAPWLYTLPLTSLLATRPLLELSNIEKNLDPESEGARKARVFQSRGFCERSYREGDA